MERLVLASKALYDWDILEKMTEINKLKKQIATPEVKVKSIDNWCDDLVEDISSGVTVVLDNEYEFSHMISTFKSFTPRQEVNIADEIEKKLFEFTNDEKWARTFAWNIIQGIKSFFDGLVESNLWENLMEQMDVIRFSKLICEIIKSRIEIDMHDEIKLIVV